MSKHSELAANLFQQGYSCSQAVFIAFCDETGLKPQTALKLASSFGGGMGRLREVCGSVSGMLLTAGMLYGYTDPKDSLAKLRHYQLVQDMAGRFRAENGSIVCRELLGLKKAGADDPTPEKRTKEYYKKRPCVELVRCAAEIMDDVIEEKKAAQKDEAPAKI